MLTRCCRCLGALGVAVSLFAAAGLAAPASAAPAALGEPAAVPIFDPNALQLAVELRRVTERLAEIPERLHDADQDVLSTTASLNVTEGLLSLNRTRLVEVEERVKQRGLVAYRRHGSSVMAPLDIERSADVAAARQYTRASTIVDTEDIAELKSIEQELQQERDRRLAARDEAIAARERVRDEREELAARQEEYIDRLNRAGAVPVMGEAMLSGIQLADWFRSTNAVPALASGYTIDDLATLYIEEGAAEGVRGDLAFAQAIIETGWFGVAAGNNYSGIGVCDSCTGGFVFTDPREGVRAQIQLLRNYADASSRASNLAHPPSPSLYGSDPEKAARLYDSFFLKGKAPLWNLMGNGNWATDPVYAPKVIGLFARMVGWAAAQATASGAP